MEQVKLEQVERAFVGWRARKKAGEHAPEQLWAKALDAARVHGVTRTARVLKLNHSVLKRRLALAAAPSDASAAVPAQTFVELPPVWAGRQEATVEVEDAAGFRLRLVLRGLDPREIAVAAGELWRGRA